MSELGRVPPQSECHIWQMLWSMSAKRFSKLAQSRPKCGQNWPIWADFGPNRGSGGSRQLSGNCSATVRPLRRSPGQMESRANGVARNHAGVGSPANFGQETARFWANWTVSRVRRNLAESGPTLVDLGRVCTTSDQVWTNAERSWATPGRSRLTLRPNSSAKAGRSWPSSAKLAPSAPHIWWSPGRSWPVDAWNSNTAA